MKNGKNTTKMKGYEQCCPQCKRIFWQQFDCDYELCPECINKNNAEKKRLGEMCQNCNAPEKYLERTVVKIGMYVSYYDVRCTLCGYVANIRYCD